MSSFIIVELQFTPLLILCVYPFLFLLIWRTLTFTETHQKKRMKKVTSNCFFNFIFLGELRNYIVGWRRVHPVRGDWEEALIFISSHSPRGWGRSCLRLHCLFCHCRRCTLFAKFRRSDEELCHIQTAFAGRETGQCATVARIFL